MSFQELFPRGEHNFDIYHLKLGLPPPEYCMSEVKQFFFYQCLVSFMLCLRL